LPTIFCDIKVCHKFKYFKGISKIVMPF